MPMDKLLASGNDREVLARWNNIYKESQSLFTPIPGITTVNSYSSYIQHPVRVGLTPEKCAELCNKRHSCKGFEYGVNYGGSGPHKGLGYWQAYPWPYGQWQGRYWHWYKLLLLLVASHLAN